MPMAPITIFPLNREPSCPLRRSAQSRNRLRPRIRVNTSSAAAMNVDNANRMRNEFSCSGWTGTRSEPRVKTNAASNTTSTPARVSGTCLFHLDRCTLAALLQVRSQRTLPAQRLPGPAELLARAHDQRVKLVESPHVAGRLALDKRTHFIIGGSFLHPAMPRQQPLGVRIGHEHAVLARVEQN